jgi:hypothetical protein
MRYQYLFPAVEAAFSVALVFVPLWRCLPYSSLKQPDGREVVTIEGTPSNACMAQSALFAMGINLPAAAVVLPILLLKYEYSDDQHDWIHDEMWRSVGFALVGVVVWFFVGRLLDDFLERHRMGAWPRVRMLDLVFAIIAAAVATLGLTGLDGPHGPQTVGLLVWIILWILIACTSIAIRVVQLMRRMKKSQGPRGK